MDEQHHIVALSGGADSSALALRLAETEPRDYRYVCTPTGDELPDVIDHWKRLEDLLGKPIEMVTPGYSLVDLTKRERMLPNFRARFCTKMLKIRPFQAWIIQRLPATAYVGLRADEMDREGSDYDLPLFVKVRYPLREFGWGRADVLEYLRQQSVTIPPRTDCARCFEQTLHEWWRLWDLHPEIYDSAVDDEDRTQHTYRSPQRDTWPASLRDLRQEFAEGRIPAIRQRRGGCRICSL